VESFEEAKEKLSAFLSKSNYSPKIEWIFREDIARFGRVTFFRVQKIKDDEVRAKEIYNRGVSKGLGITLASKFYTSQYTAAYVWVPENEDEAIRHLQNPGIKLSLETKMADPKIFKELEIKKEWLWKMAKILNQNKNNWQYHFDLVPNRY
jgi:hypothetical protein